MVFGAIWGGFKEDLHFTAFSVVLECTIKAEIVVCCKISPLFMLFHIKRRYNVCGGGD